MYECSGHLRVATRRSELAVIQTTQWMDKIVQLVPDLVCELVEIDSAGDLQLSDICQTSVAREF